MASDNESEAPIEAGNFTDESDEFTPEDYNPTDDDDSVTSSIYRHAFENGRRYHHYRGGRYPIPNDDVEQDREDMKHAQMLELTDGLLHLAPIGNHPQKIIDIGTGTGIWAIDMADKYPSAQVTGIDLSPIQPPWVPPNVSFLIDDAEDEWMSGDGFDLVHVRHVSNIMKNLPKLLERAFENLKPGGWFETQDLEGVLRCDDDTMTDDFPLKQFMSKVGQAMSLFGFDFGIVPKIGAMMEKAGYVNVQKKVYKVPCGTWPKDRRLKLIGMYQRVSVESVLGATAGKPFLALGMSQPEIEVFLVGVRKALKDDSVHAYFNFYFWTGQKPL
ncbi:S-adenosyl-L-methionine-dependent methyltransferase [Thozetella sp. PMI_491]|nr:S-adenosyl-L-methionine-dependent methyltransferase [Thozetella sp. PMI_491]